MMDYDGIEKLTQDIRIAQLSGDEKHCKDLMFEAYEYCFNYYILACEILRRTNDSNLIDMIIGMRDALDNFGILHTEHVEKMNYMD